MLTTTTANTDRMVRAIARLTVRAARQQNVVRDLAPRLGWDHPTVEKFVRATARTYRARRADADQLALVLGRQGMSAEQVAAAVADAMVPRCVSCRDGFHEPDELDTSSVCRACAHEIALARG